MKFKLGSPDVSAASAYSLFSSEGSFTTQFVFNALNLLYYSGIDSFPPK